MAAPLDFNDAQPETDEPHQIIKAFSVSDDSDPIRSIRSLPSSAGLNNEGIFTLDTLLEQIGMGNFQLIRFLAAGFMAFMDGTVVMTLSLSLVVLENEWNFGSTAESVVASVVFASVVVGAYISGPIADKYGRRMPMIISSFFICIVNLASAFSTNIIIYTILRACLAFGCGFYSPIGFTYVLEIMPPSLRGKIVTIGYSMLFIGELYACIVSLFALDSLDTGDWQALTLWSTVPALLSLMISIPYMDESLRFLLINRNFKTAMAQLKDAAASSWSQEKVEITEDTMLQLQEWVQNQEKRVEAKKNSQPGVGALLQTRFRKMTLITWLAWFSMSFVYYGLTLFFPYILNQLTTEAEAQNGFSSAVVAISGDSLTGYTISIGLESLSVVISYFVIDSKKLGRKNGMIFFFGLSALFALLAFVDRGIISLVIWTTVLRIMLDVCSFYCYLLALESYPTRYRATGVGAATAVGKAGTVLMPWICALLLDVDLYGPYFGFFMICTMAAVATVWLPTDISRREMT